MRDWALGLRARRATVAQPGPRVEHRGDDRQGRRRRSAAPSGPSRRRRRAKKIPPMIGKTEIRPGQLTSMLDPVAQRRTGRGRASPARAATSSASAQRGSSSKLPADDGAGEDREAVDQRVEQRPQAAVLAGDAGEEAVDVVAGGDQPEDDRRRGACAPSPDSKARTEEERDRREPQRSRPGSGSSRG